jgi:hypothetical protein
MLVLGLAACGGKKSSPPPPAANASPAASAVTNAANATVAKGGEHVVVTGTISLNGSKLTLNGSGDFKGDPALGELLLTIKGAVSGSMDEITSGSTAYLKSPLLAAALPAGKTWASVSLTKATKAFGINLNSFTNATPTATLGFLSSAKNVKKIGDGHYRATIDLSKVAGASAKAIPVDVWVNSDGLIEKVVTAYTGTKITTTFSKYGESVNVKVPSASETVDIAKLGG